VDGGGVELTVEDSGKGIAERDLALLFEPFYTTKQEGLGRASQSVGALCERTAGRFGLRTAPGAARSSGACYPQHNRPGRRLRHER
jgi:C4-dicarboxylate-specific signal transduction histidine kinase